MNVDRIDLSFDFFLSYCSTEGSKLNADRTVNVTVSSLKHRTHTKEVSRMTESVYHGEMDDRMVWL